MRLHATMTSFLLVLLVGTAALCLSGCSDQSGLPYGTVYKAVDGNPSIKIVSSKELEWTRGGDRLVCEYSREGERLRVVVSMFGAKQAVYLSIVPDGLREEDGTVFYRPDRYAQVMATINAQRRQKELDSKVVEAAGKGDSAAVRQLLSSGARATALNSQGFPAIHVAAESGSEDTVKALLDAGANCNVCDNEGVTALHRAVNMGGRNVGLRDAIENRRARTANDEAILKLLLMSGADIDARTKDGHTPLMIAVTRRNAEAVRFLVAAGADRDLKVGNKQAKDMGDGDAEILAALRTPKDEEADAAVLKGMLQSGKPFFGQERSRQSFAFQISFEDFDERSGRFNGIMNYYPPEDKSILTIEGKLEGSVLSFAHTGVRKQGRSTAEWQYSLRVHDAETLTGHYTKKGSDRKGGEFAIDLNESRRSDAETKVTELIRFENLKEQACTATKELLRVTQRPSFSSASEVILTDVSIKGRWPNAEELLFARISKLVMHQSGKNWEIVIEGPAKSGFGNYRRDIEFRDNRAECDKFYQAFSEAYEAWKTKYAEVLRKPGE